MTRQHADRPLLGALVDAKDAWGHMRAAAASLQGAEILVISAYLTVDGLRALLADVAPNNRVRILVRWQPNDLVTGASDLASFDFANERGWEFFASPSLHAKAFVFGEAAIFMGSANLTRNGFALGVGRGNTEMLTQVPNTTQNTELLRRMFMDGLKVDAELAKQIRTWLAGQTVPVVDNMLDLGSAWPLEARARALRQQALSSLTVSECFMTDGSGLYAPRDQQTALSDAQRHDLSLLGQLESTQPTQITHAFRQTKIFQWLEQQLTRAPNRELYFGTLSVALHEALIDDPRPYRRDVKTLVVHLLAWLKAVPDCGVQVDRPNHSERLRFARLPHLQ
jgi:hypothetical protein